MPDVAEAFADKFDSLDDATAGGYLRSYFLRAPGERNEGAYFADLGPPWTDAKTAYEITPADLLSLSLLNARVDAQTIVAVTRETVQAEAHTQLRRIPLSATIVDDYDYLADGEGAWTLWDQLSRIHGMVNGATTKSKLLARKRPLLVPIFDTVIRDYLGLEDSTGFWMGMREALRADDRARYERAARWATSVGLDSSVTPLRVIDVVMWKAAKAAFASAAP